MVLTEHKSIAKLKTIWNSLYACSDLSFFQSFAWNKSLQKSLYLQKLFHYPSMKRKRLRYYVIDDICIIPLVVDERERHVYLLGDDKPSDYLSFIYGRIDVSTMIQCLLLILESFRDYTFHINREENTTFWKAMESVKKLSEYTVHSHTISNIAVLLAAHREEGLYPSLSKSTRQNYRTALNRIAKDGLHYEIKTMIGPLGRQMAMSLFACYFGRRKDCEDKNRPRTWISRIKTFLWDIVCLPNDPLSFCSIEHEVFVSYILIDGVIAAFCEGGMNASGDSLEISRVATNVDYYKYSPGMVLLIDTIERVKHQYDLFDLTRGNEDYKYKLGGTEHYSFSYMIGDIEG